jgi:hypothetical protein
VSGTFWNTPALLVKYPAFSAGQADNAVAGDTSYRALEALTALLVSIVSIRTNI